MKIESIKNALKVHVTSLNIAPVSVSKTVPNNVVGDDNSNKKIQSTTWTENPSAVNVVVGDKNNDGKDSVKVTEKIVPKIEGVIPDSQIQTPSPIEKTPAKPARKTRKKADTNSVIKVEETTTADLESLIVKHLRAGTDYDTIPNCGRKPALLKAGAEHLAQLFKFRTTSEIVNRVEVFEKNFILYEVATTVYNASGEMVAVGLGSCNTLERKYIKQGLAMSLNTVLKMARKRSYVDAILSATGTSRIFTQDIEELKELAATIEVTPDNQRSVN